MKSERSIVPRCNAHWATLSGDGQGAALPERNPLKGLPVPKEEYPRRPMIDETQYVKLRKIAPQVDGNFELALVLAHETGHRKARSANFVGQMLI